MAITNNLGRCDFVGAVVSVFCQDYRAMSDVYTWATFAKVWDSDKGQTREVLVNANFECDTSEGRAVVDATPEVLAAVAAYEQAQELQARKNEELQAQKRMEAALKAPLKGRVVTVVKGRKVAIGTTGLVFWTGFDSYGAAKLGIATSNRKTIKPGQRYASFVDVVWVAASNCEALPNQAEAIQAYPNEG